MTEPEHKSSPAPGTYAPPAPARLAMTVARTALFSLLAAAAFIMIFGSHTARIGFLDLRLSVRPMPHGPGVTEFVFRPLGRISADTHKFPARLTLSVERIDEDIILDLARGRMTYQDLTAQALEKSGPFFMAFAKKILALGVCGGIFGAALSFLFVPGVRERLVLVLLRRVALGSVIGGGFFGLLLSGGLLYGVFFTFDPSAFRNPRYEGLVARAPDAAAVIQKGVGASNILADQMLMLSRNMSEFFLALNRIQKSSRIEGAPIRILHVSDMHNNPLSVVFMRALVTRLEPDVILDTGDLTDHGSPEELEFIAGIRGFDIPYYAITGNHDSEDVRQRLEQDFGIKVLEGEEVTVKGLRIMGFGDPKAREHFPKTAVMDAPGLQALARQIRKTLKGMRRRPHVLMVHDPVASRQLLGEAPLILSGHTHNAVIQKRKGTVYINAGTTGASGVRYFKNNEKPFYSMAVIDVTLGIEMRVERVAMLYADTIESDLGVYVKQFE